MIEDEFVLKIASWMGFFFFHQAIRVIHDLFNVLSYFYHLDKQHLSLWQRAVFVFDMKFIKSKCVIETLNANHKNEHNVLKHCRK